MKLLPKSEIILLREKYPTGTRVVLIRMNDPYSNRLAPVDDIGTIHVHWDCGSSLGVAYGEDICKVLNENE